MPHPVRSAQCNLIFPTMIPSRNCASRHWRGSAGCIFSIIAISLDTRSLDHVPKREKFSVYYWLGRFASLTLLPFDVLQAKLRTALINPLAHLSDFLNLYTLYRPPPQIEAWLRDARV